MTGETTELTCRDLTTFLADYLAEDTSPEERSRFDAHLAECPECVAYLRSYRATIQLARGAFGEDPVPADVPERLVRAILAAREHTRRTS
jgi:anti-sigma factor RsiW